MAKKSGLFRQKTTRNQECRNGGSQQYFVATSLCDARQANDDGSNETVAVDVDR